MRVFTVTPVKPLSKAKARLSSILSSEERRFLTLYMLEDVLKAVKDVVNDAVVISMDVEVLSFALKHGALPLIEVEAGLNQAVGYAVEWCMKQGAEAVVVLPADVPLIQREDLLSIIKCLERVNIVISPSINGGTNALALRPPNAIKPCYGPRSFKFHLSEAKAKKLSYLVYESPRIALDIDSKEELLRFIEVESPTRTYEYLRSLQRIRKAT